MPATATALPVSFTPCLHPRDPLGAYWLRNVTLRLRREIAWLWRERSAGPAVSHRTARDTAPLPPLTDRLETSLDLSRHAVEKQTFFRTDETAAYLSKLIAQSADRDTQAPERGSFSWVARELHLSDVDCFVLALACSPVLDSAAGPVYAACLNDPGRQHPTLGLAQRLWDTPDELFALGHSAHPLFAHGLILPLGTASGLTWDAPLTSPALIADTLFRPGQRAQVNALVPIPPEALPLPNEAAVAVARLRSTDTSRTRLLPIVGARDVPLASVAATLAARADLMITSPAWLKTAERSETWLSCALTLSWLQGVALYLPFEALAGPPCDAHAAPMPVTLPLPSLPSVICVGLNDRAALKRLPTAHALPPFVIPASTYHQRLEWWRDHLPGARRDASLEAALAEASRRFRYERNAILSICHDLRSLGRPVEPADVFAACRADLDLGDLAQPVTPRFEEPDLMLPPKQTRQLQELIQAMRALTTVHYEWGTERAWNESGLTALFAGPPGTGKTMCAEVVAAALDLPLYRIDLSQVVNKYIGETEKNLRRLFDAAEQSDVILFFDEADSLFGKRCEVKDAHDRYANLEISYLLERMERFKGLAILATNRKKDLDEAFLRRLRFLFDFPLPGADERLRIWKRVIPAGVDASALDFSFLAQRFPFAGGHIRSIVFQACLQSAQPGGARKLTMEAVIASVKREYEKLDRSISLEQFGPYSGIAAQLS